MNWIASTATAPGHGLDDDMVDVATVESLIFDLEPLNLLPPEDIETMADCWDHDGETSMAELEVWLEGLPELLAGLSLETWGKICLRICPQLYGDPEAAGSKASQAAPRTKAKMAALRRRYEGQTPLFHPRDTDGLPHLEHRSAPVVEAKMREAAWQRMPPAERAMMAARKLLLRLIRALIKLLRRVLFLIRQGGLLLLPFALHHLRQSPHQQIEKAAYEQTGQTDKHRP